MSDHELERELQRLVQAIYAIMKAGIQGGWPTWDYVSKWLTGTADNAALLSGIAQLPANQHLFHFRGNAVRLTTAGIQMASTAPPEVATIHGLVAKAVVEYARQLKPIKMTVRSADSIARAGARIVHAVQVEITDEIIPADTPVTLFPKSGRSTQGKLVGQGAGGGTLYIAFDTQILPADLPGQLEIDRGYLLGALAAQLEALAEFPPRMLQLFGDAADLPLIASDDSRVVADELAALAAPWTRYLWGPPGAGKTYGVARFVARLLRSNPTESILIVAPSNRAVDVAMSHVRNWLTVDSMASLLADRRVLRFGYPRKKEIVELPELLGPTSLDELSHRVRQRSQQIAIAEQTQAQESDLALLRAELLADQEAVKTAVHEHVARCQVVATTTTLAYMPSSPIATRMWDTVIVDEVTMVPPAVCTFLASRAKSRFLLAGDPRQLGPVFEGSASAGSSTWTWLGQDIFELGGLSTGEGEQRQVKTDDRRLTRITAQRRCATDIWANVERLYPGVANHGNADRFRTLARLPPACGQAVALLDTSESRATCRRRQGSWENEFTADLALEVATTVAAEVNAQSSIAIVSPYRAQVRLLRQRIREERKADSTPFRGLCSLDAGTVHQFQGSEADVVILDLVDGVGRDVLGALLRADTGMRMINVAITRAKGKLVVIADKKWYRHKAHLELHNCLLSRLILGTSVSTSVEVIPPSEPENAAMPASDGTESPIESMLLRAMRAYPELSGVKTQHRVENELGVIVSRADFAFPEAKYAVYCDGRQWHLREDRWQKDIRQRNSLAEIGWAFSVFAGPEIHRDADKCARQVLKTLKIRTESSKGAEDRRGG